MVGRVLPVGTAVPGLLGLAAPGGLAAGAAGFAAGAAGVADGAAGLDAGAAGRADSAALAGLAVGAGRAEPTPAGGVPPVSGTRLLEAWKTCRQEPQRTLPLASASC